MKKTIQFAYNKWFALLAIIFLSFLIALFIIRSYQLNDLRQIRILEYFEEFFIILLLYIFYKYFIPYLKKRAALELNEFGIIDNVRNRKVYWNNIKKLRLINFRTGGSGIAIDLKDNELFLSDLNYLQKLLSWVSKFSYDTPMIIPLQYISGSKNEIFQTIQFYFKNIVIEE